MEAQAQQAQWRPRVTLGGGLAALAVGVAVIAGGRDLWGEALCNLADFDTQSSTIVEDVFNPSNAAITDHCVATRWSPPGSIIPEDHAFIVNQRGLLYVRTRGSDGSSVDATLLDMEDEIFSWHDRGLLSMAIHPDYGVDGNYYVYGFYTGLYGSEGDDNHWTTDDCQVFPNAADARPFCEAPGVLERFIMEPIMDDGEVVGYEPLVRDQILVEDWCGSSLTHHIGTIAFLRDGGMVLTAGEASQALNEIDTGLSYDPCMVDDGEPDRPQGAFRSQRDEWLSGKALRFTAESLLKDSELVKDEDFFVIAKGLRNPFRLTVHPESGDVYIGDVGSSGTAAREEINLIPDPVSGGTDAPVLNFGWPCMEGVVPHPEFRSFILNAPDSPEKSICQSIYNNNMDEYRDPVYHYRDTSVEPFDPDQPDACTPGGSTNEGAIASLLFYGEGPLEDVLQGKLIFSDYAKQCAVYFDNDADGMPDFDSAHILFEGEEYVDLTQAPDGFLYLTVWSGSLNGIQAMTQVSDVTPPVAALKVDREVANVEEGGTLEFDATDSSLSNLGDSINLYMFDYDGDGEVDEENETGIGSYTYTEKGIFVASVTVSTEQGGVDCESIPVIVGVDLEVEFDPPSGEWEAGDNVSFELTITGEDVPADGITWSQRTKHCIFDTCAGIGRCHFHSDVVDGEGTGYSGSFSPLAHELPSSVFLTASFEIDGTAVVRSFETMAKTYQFQLSSTPVLGASFRTGESGETCQFSNPPCVLGMMAENNLAVSLASRYQAEQDKFYAFTHYEFTHDGSTEEVTRPTIIDRASSDGTIVAHFEEIELELDETIERPNIGVAEARGFEQIYVEWNGIPDTDHFVIHLATTTEEGNPHLPHTVYPTGTVVPSSTLNDLLVVPDGNYDLIVTVRALNLADGTMGPPSDEVMVSMEASDGECVDNIAECVYHRVECTRAVSDTARANGLGAFYDLYCLEDPDRAGCTTAFDLEAGCRTCFTDRCLWADATGEDPGIIPDCPPCVADLYQVDQPTGTCEDSDFESQTGYDPTPRSSTVPDFEEEILTPSPSGVPQLPDTPPPTHIDGTTDPPAPTPASTEAPTAGSNGGGGGGDSEESEESAEPTPSPTSSRGTDGTEAPSSTPAPVGARSSSGDSSSAGLDAQSTIIVAAAAGGAVLIGAVVAAGVVMKKRQNAVTG